MSGKVLGVTILALLVIFAPFTAFASFDTRTVTSEGEALSTDNTLNILYTGAIRGELEPCGCSPKSNSGGLARLSTYISSNIEALKPYILIDAGNSMAKDTPQGRLKSAVLLKSFRAINYDVTAFTESDMLSLSNLDASSVDKTGASAISMASPYPSSIQLQPCSSEVETNTSTDPGAYKDGLLNILLADITITVAKELTGWDVIILSSGETLEEPIEVNGTIIISGYPKGEKLGILSVVIDTEGRVNSFTHKWLSLEEDIADDPKIRELINKYDKEVAILFDNLAEVEALNNTTYLGYENCTECHQPFIEQWQTTRHADAFATLERVGKSRDPECIVCHTTGYGAEGGFYNITTTPRLTNIQCEECHGPGQEHLSDYSAPLKPVQEATCLKCHTEENSPDFDFSTYIKKIQH
jgi:hypothetical protein